MERELQSRIAAALMIDTLLEEIAADLGVPVERVRAEIDQMKASVRESKKPPIRPSEQPRRHWLKFTLRGLILLTVGVSLFLGGRASRQREIERMNAQQQQMIEKLEKAQMEVERVVSQC